MNEKKAGVAQLVERRTENPYVVSSTLTAGTKTFGWFRGSFFMRFFDRFGIRSLQCGNWLYDY